MIEGVIEEGIYKERVIEGVIEGGIYKERVIEGGIYKEREG